MKPVTGLGSPSSVSLPDGESGQLTGRATRPKTRRPPAVRSREPQASLQASTVQQSEHHALPHSSPALSTSSTIKGSGPLASAPMPPPAPTPTPSLADIDNLVVRLYAALAAPEFDELNQVLDEIAERGWQFDRQPLCFHVHAWEFAQRAPMMVLRAEGDCLSDSVIAQVQRLIALGCDPNSSDDDDTSLLMQACKVNHPAFAQYLLQCPGINPHKLNWWGKNAAMVAHEQGNVALTPLMARAKIQLHPANPALALYKRLRAENNDQRYAALMGQLRMVLDEDHFVSLVDDEGKTLLLRAVEDGELAVVELLCKLETAPNILLRDADGNSVFDLAAGIDDEAMRADILRLLHALRRDTLASVRFKRY